MAAHKGLKHKLINNFVCNVFWSNLLLKIVFPTILVHLILVVGLLEVTHNFNVAYTKWIILHDNALKLKLLAQTVQSKQIIKNYNKLYVLFLYFNKIPGFIQKYFWKKKSRKMNNPYVVFKNYLAKALKKYIRMLIKLKNFWDDWPTSSYINQSEGVLVCWFSNVFILAWAHYLGFILEFKIIK